MGQKEGKEAQRVRLALRGLAKPEFIPRFPEFDDIIIIIPNWLMLWCGLSGIDSSLVEIWIGHRSSITQVYFVSEIEDLSNPKLLERFTKEYEKNLPSCI